ncbi:hypothetical protein DXU93_07800 [Brumimicrobium aurantiacum]|uniref:Uncharacterized protein n=2 Tax=Brumimicrobium aurantiacum TaxID=1737063 RepID=A0A3E1EXY3_9FLAO|nr:hypothetical protein DXU93_07800 [Brumimicrobium aurantiacum]
MKAEKAILDTNYSDAVAIYDSLFKEYEFVFAKHIYTATQTAIENNDLEKAFDFIKKGALEGVKINEVDKDPILVKLKKDSRWEAFRLEYDSLRKIYIRNVNWEARNCINKMYDLDQEYRDKHELKPWNFMLKPFIRMKWNKVLGEMVNKELTPLIDSLGFPGERLVGLDEQWMHHKRRNDGLESTFGFFILIHYFSKPRDTSLNEMLYDEIKKGNILPEQYAALIDFQAEWGKGKFYKGIHYNQWHTTDQENSYAQIDYNRSEIGLENLEILELKRKRGFKIIKERNKGNVHHHIKLWHIGGY